MTFSGLLVQLLNGLADASSLFLVAAGLSLIFGVTRIVNFAHGSFYMLGVYLSYTLVSHMGGTVPGFWLAVIVSAAVVALVGALIEVTILRRIYHAPELFQLLATFSLALIIQDATLFIWGPEDLFGPRAPGLDGSIEILGRQFPEYNLLLIAIGPVVLGLLWLLLTRTRWGTLIRAATQDREMVSALGVNQAWLFTSVFALGCFLAGLGGALQEPRLPANLALDMEAIGTAFVIVVVGGMGSIPGAFLAALLISELKALCIAIGTLQLFGIDFSFSKLTLVVEFLVMAIILVIRPWGLLGKPQAPSRNSHAAEAPLRGAQPKMKWAAGVLVLALVAVPFLRDSFPYAEIILVEIFIAVLFAASLHFIMGPGGMHSFGHAAYFGLGAYGAAILVTAWHLPMELALIFGPLLAVLGALLFGWFSVRLSGVYLAMLTLAFAQIVWSIVYQWDDVTGGSNGIFGVWPADWLSSSSAFYYLVLGITLVGVLVLRRILFAPFGMALRAGRDSDLRADAIGIDVKRIQWAAFVVAGLFGGIAGAVFAFSKGGISPEAIGVGRSIDGLVMVLLGGVQTLVGPIVGASIFTWLHDSIARETEYWKAVLGMVILFLVLLFPAGVVGSLTHFWHWIVARKKEGLNPVSIKAKEAS
ncbi:ABC transporter permease [Neptunomonas phycophila]|jgi:branched-chain amino acid transport system permease protein|uniref:ABC transporter permease n=1 Tax=Neptunomonas phycophila TaxID=1572645 RepID=A0AAW7XHZ9_9GAMM|nr:ABC transporter permease [Neptunomonas phycophila]MDO6453252.1 ABC transporter permease [Neptunomonas phycophila]MDO6469355.1 ABC transporter permease [Neptunomonas phycophila]MDO6784311.1 ABC transporter permease [Neptunomonas phycophila]MDP2522902.1 ABC transporter permease [Neptunomonas phycophila]